MKIRLEYSELTEGYSLTMADGPHKITVPVVLDLFDSMPGNMVQELEVSLPTNVRVTVELIRPLRDFDFDPRRGDRG